MKVLKNEALGKYTTFGIGGIARNFYIPQSESELISLVQQLECEHKDYLFMGGGSNLLINDDKTFENVILLKEFNSEVNIEGNIVSVGASFLLPKLIVEINKAGLGGIEYLYSVPGTIGGAICMNAGRGRKYGMCLSYYLLSVKVLQDGNVKEYTKEQCEFGYRSSVFQGKNMIVLSAEFAFDSVSEEESAGRRKERLELCKKKQDSSGRNFGTVFCEANMLLMKLIRRIQLGKNSQVQFSGKTLNWLINKGKGNYKEALKLIEQVEKIHHAFRLNIRKEVVIWK